MPTRVTKQKPTTVARSPDTQKELSSNGVQQVGIKLNVYGRGKTGKTRLACTFPKPLLLIGTEDGTRSVCTNRRPKPPHKHIYELLIGGEPTGVDFVRLERSQDIEELVKLSGYNSYGLDNAGGLQDIILKEILGLDEIPIQKTWGMAERSHWITCGAQTKERLRSIIDLADQQGKNVVIIAHERNFDESGDSEVTIPSIGSALTPAVAAWLNGACDYICQTFIREHIEQRTSKIGGKEVTTNVRTGKHDYCLRTGPHSVYMTGFRLPPEAKLPDMIVDPNYQKILRIIQG